MACRSVEKANLAKEEILATYPNAKLDVIAMDNMDFSSVRQFAKAFHSNYDRLDYLLNNAGIMAQPLIKSKDGFDIQFQTNHLAHFLLTKLMWDKMKTPGQARVVNVSSSAHSTFSSWGFLGINIFLLNVVLPLLGMRQVDQWLRYCVSKLSNVLMMREMEEKINQKKLTDQVIVAACHPGYANTSLQYVGRGFFWFYRFGNRLFAQSAADGSLPILHATLAVSVQNGDYFGPRFYAVGPPRNERVQGHGNDRKMAASLWDYSEECVGERFNGV